MKNFLGGSHIENRTALVLGGLSALLLALVWGYEDKNFSLEQVGLSLGLAGCVVLADCFPIHIRYATKISLISVPLFLIAVLLPRPLALAAAGVGIFGADWFTRHTRGLIPMEFIQDPARWVLIIFISTGIVFLGSGGHFADALLPVVAVCMFLLDVLTFSLFTSINIHEPFWGLVREGLTQTYSVETAQYLIGILGALAYHRATWSLLLLVLPTVIIYSAFKNAKEMNHSTRELLVSMADAVDLRDQYTGGHSRRVAELAARILERMGIAGVEAELIRTAARLHDIGKIGIPDAVLLKPGELTPAEWEVMRSHPGKGAELLGRYADFARGCEMVLYHHEHWNGAGYPRGLKAHKIPFGARVIAVADAFDAITTNRPYRSGKSIDEAVQILGEGSNVQWDKDVVDALLDALQEEQSETPQQ